jgi:predicted RNA binding protein YcfA (HicA-like mRNA interferase family)
MYPKTLAEVNPSVRARVTVERRIVKKTVDALLAAGYALATDQGGHRFYDESNPTLDRKTILAQLCETDDEYLGVFKADEATGVERVVQPLGYVYFVYGNDGWDVISDYTTNLEKVLAPVNDYAVTFED